MSDEEVKTDKEEYDMAEHFKSIYEKKEKEIKRLKEENLQLKKMVITNYALIRVIDNLFDGYDLDDDSNESIFLDLNSIQQLVEVTRAVNSKNLDDLFIL